MIRLGTRNSPLALRQAAIVQELLHQQGIESQICGFTAEGDRDLTTPLYESVTRGVFTKDLETRLASGDVDCVIHCLKDLPTVSDSRFQIVAVLNRDDYRDVLISGSEVRSLSDLPKGFKLGTSSLRRSHWFQQQCSRVECVSIRGNVNTRLEKLAQGQYDGIVLAKAAFDRMNWKLPERSLILESLPAPAQGALAIQVRSEDELNAKVLKKLNDPVTEENCAQERQLLHLLQGGCSLPLGALVENSKLQYWIADATAVLQGTIESHPWGLAAGAFWKIQSQRKSLDRFSLISTRPAGSEDLITQVLEDAGARVYRRPLVQARVLRDSLDRVVGENAEEIVIITSARTVQILDRKNFGKKARFAAVGESSARAIREHWNQSPDWVGSFSVESLKTLLPRNIPWVQIGHERAQRIDALGEFIAVYTMETVVPSEWPENGKIPVLITSPEIAEHYKTLRKSHPVLVFGNQARQKLDGSYEIGAFSQYPQELAWKIWQYAQGV